MPDLLGVEAWPKMTTALTAAQRGWRVFPLHDMAGGACSCWDPACGSPGKHPRTRQGVKDATTDTHEIVSWWGDAPSANIGVATGDGLFVVDLDRHHEGANGVKVWAELTALHGCPDTFTVITPSGGMHKYFATDEPLRNTAGKIAPGIDTRGEGGYVVGPGSSAVVDGVRKSWTVSIDVPPAPLPDWVRDLVLAKPERPKPADPPQRISAPGATSDVYARAALTSAAANVANAAPGTRNVTLNEETFSVAGLIGKGVSHEEVWQTMYDAAMQAGLGDGESRKTLASAMAAGVQNPREVPERTQTARTYATPETPGRKLRLRWDDDLDKIPPVTWLIQGILPTGFSVLYGRSGCGKSLLGLDWACSIATPRPWNGHQIVTPGRALYLIGEGAGGLAKRRQAWQTHRGARTNGLVVCDDTIDLLNPDDEAAALDAVRETRAVLMVVDTLAQSWSGEENAASDMGLFINACNRIRSATGVSVLVIHHERLAEGRMGGSTALYAAADWVMHMREEWDHARALHNAPPAGKHRDMPQMPNYRFTVEQVRGTGSVTLVAT